MSFIPTSKYQKNQPSINTNNNKLINSNLNLDNYLFIKYAPITSVDVEKSFPICKNILCPNSQSFTKDSLSMYLHSIMFVNFF